MKFEYVDLLKNIKLKLRLQHMDVLKPGEWVGALKPWMDTVSLAGNRSEMSADAKEWRRPFCGVMCRMHEALTQLPTFFYLPEPIQVAHRNSSYIRSGFRRG